MTAFLAGLLGLLLGTSAGWCIGYLGNPRIRVVVVGTPAADTAVIDDEEEAFKAKIRAQFDDLTANLDVPSDLDDGESPFGWRDPDDPRSNAA